MNEPFKIPRYQESDWPEMRAAGRLAAQVLDYITPFVQIGISTEELDSLCHRFILDHQATPAPLDYQGFPKATCISLNHVVCHGIPCSRKLKEGDILNIDITVLFNGWYGDTSRMFTVGAVSHLAKRLIQVTQESLDRAISIVKPGIPLVNIGAVIQNFVENQGFSVVRDYCGHGIGRVFHDDPQVPHFKHSGTKTILEEGMFFTIEPMINAGRPDTKVLADEWTAVTRDRSLSAQFEHSLGVTASGVEVFTISPS
jgi:methionyl aminopeptidase